MPASLVLLLAGPLQSWGECARFHHRDTVRHPTRSGLIGLLAAAQGQPREADPGWAAELEMAIRIDRPGQVLEDFHTVGGADGGRDWMVTAEGKRRTDPVITRRHYLADAAFLVVVSGEQQEISRLMVAGRSPRWAPFLGRRGCPPALPIHVGTSQEPARALVERVPLYRKRPSSDDAVDVTVISDGARADGSTQLRDVPISFDPFRREYDSRFLAAEAFEVPGERCAGTGLVAYETMTKAVNDERR